MAVDTAIMNELYTKLGISSTEAEPTPMPEDPSMAAQAYEQYEELPLMQRLALDIAPGTGNIIAGYETPMFAKKTKEAAEEGNILGMLGQGALTGLSALGMIPGLGMGIRGVKAGVKAATKGLRKFAPEDIEIAMKTGEVKGFIGPSAVTPRHVSETSKAEDTILNYGSGKHDIHTPLLREKGLNVEAHDFHNPNPEALGRKHDTVFGSNVINVQETDNMLKNTLDEMTETVASDGRLIVNLPVSPRKGAWTGDITDTKKLRGLLKDRFESVNIVDGTGSAPVFEARIPKLKQSKSKIKRTRTRPQDRDYPTTRLSDKLSDKNTIQFLEDHGYIEYTPGIHTDKASTWEYTDNGIRAYTSWTKRGGTKGVSQRTFNNPTLKSIRSWMGYKQGGSIVERNPNTYNMRAI